MNDQTIQLLQTLADKFGTTVDHLWGALLRQAKIEAGVDVIIIALLVFLLIASIRIVKKKTRPRDPADNYGRPEWDEDASTVALGLIIIVGFCTLLAVCVGLHDIITALANPEFWALKQIIK